MEDNTEFQELYCHRCGNYVQFKIDLGLEGNHVIICPKCGHEHCRVVRNGKITDIRWDSRNDDDRSNSQIYYATVVSTSQTSTWTTYIGGSTSSGSSTSSDSTGKYFLYNSWVNSMGVLI